MGSLTSSNENGHVTITFGREGIGLNGKEVDAATLSFEYGYPTWADTVQSYFNNDRITNSVELSLTRGNGLSGVSIDVAIDPNGLVDAAGHSINPSSSEVYVGTVSGTGSLLGFGGSTEVDIYYTRDQLSGDLDIGLEVQNVFAGLTAIAGEYYELEGMGFGGAVEGKAGILFDPTGVYLISNVDAVVGLGILGHASLPHIEGVLKIAGPGLLPQPPECFGPETPIDMWPLDPEFAPDPSNPNKVFDQDAVRAKIWKKPIAMICKGDTVVSFDKNDNLMPGRVTRTFENESKILLDYFGTRVTPGHVYFRPDSKKTDKFECLLDILRDDGMIQNVEGRNIRAATNVPVGDPRDGFVWAITQGRKDGIVVEKERGRIRLGTRFIVDGKSSQSVADAIDAKGGFVGDDELIRFGNADPAPFVWEHGAILPKPEDFVLQASGTTLTDVYKAGEWESHRPHMPAPMVMDGGPVQPLSATAVSAMPRNQPLNLQAASAPKRTTRPPMNRKQRKAMEAKQRKALKMRNKAAV